MPYSVIVCPARNQRAARIVSNLLAQQPDLRVSECSECAELAHRADLADAIVVTIGVADMHDPSHLERALARHPDESVIVVTLYDDPRISNRLRERGAAALVAMDRVVGGLPRLIRELAAAPGLAAVAAAVGW